MAAASTKSCSAATYVRSTTRTLLEKALATQGFTIERIQSAGGPETFSEDGLTTSHVHEFVRDPEFLDYTFPGMDAQRVALDAFASAHDVAIACLPTGQGLMIRPRMVSTGRP